MMTTKNFEIIYLKKQNRKLDFDDLDESEIFIHYMFTRILDISENHGGQYSEMAVKKAKLLKKMLCSPQILRKLPGLKDLYGRVGFKS